MTEYERHLFENYKNGDDCEPLLQIIDAYDGFVELIEKEYKEYTKTNTKNRRF